MLHKRKRNTFLKFKRKQQREEKCRTFQSGHKISSHFVLASVTSKWKKSVLTVLLIPVEKGIV